MHTPYSRVREISNRPSFGMLPARSVLATSMLVQCLSGLMRAHTLQTDR